MYRIFLLLVTCLLFACSDKDPDPVVRINPESFTVDDERKIGEELEAAIAADAEGFPVLDRSARPENAQIYDYLGLVMNSMVRTQTVTRRDSFEWRLTVLEDDGFSGAFVLPGGHLYVYTGLLKFLEAEHELVAVLAHELAYADEGHVVKNLKNGYGSDGGSILGDVLLGKEVPEVADMPYALRDMVFSAQDVAMADSFAVSLLCPFLYDMLGLVDMVDRLDLVGGEVDWLVNRPGGDSRIEDIGLQVSACGNDDNATFEERYQEYKGMLP